MNIQEAKEEIARTLRAYAKKDESGRYLIPPEKQRPMLLIGPPGIGKTAIMKQIADELSCGLVSYAMTHHTRQSAIGLPFITEKEYGGKKWSVTEYTMSEIVASIYEYMKETGKDSGILFLDEINCVSETLTPVMLQLLQNKTFGNTPLPKGWVIVAAGNPSEYNKSVKELDMVTMDRVKNMDIEADLSVWLSYALKQRIHPAIRTYLSIYPDHFYSIKERDGKQYFVTARAWEDLSLLLSSYEEDGIEVSPDWFLQYLQDEDIARSFGLYYDLFKHYSKDLPKETETSSLAKLLLSDTEKIKDISSTEWLSISAMLFHSIEYKASETKGSKETLALKKRFISLIPSPDDKEKEDELISFFKKRRAGLEERFDKGLVKTEDVIREKRVLASIEDDILSYKKQDKEDDFLSFEEKINERNEKEIQRKEDALRIQIEDALKLLSNSKEAKNALLYFTEDLARSQSCAALLPEDN